MNASSSADDGLLYHYTSFEAFANIIDKSELWASHIRYLNDISEQRIMWDLLKVQIEERLRTADAVLAERLSQALAVAKAPPEEDVYVLSFCKDGGDLLSQWRGYSAGCGVSIGFPADTLQRYCEYLTKGPWNDPPLFTPSASLSAVRYVNPTATDDLSKQLAEIFLNPDPDFGIGRKDETSRRFAYALSRLAADLKHSAFSEEAEWRITMSGVMPSETLKFRMRKSLLVPYIAFPLGEKGRVSHLISKIVVGPNPHSAEVLRAVKKMVQSTNIAVVGSSTPYRDW
jgi:hypothetical protein